MVRRLVNEKTLELNITYELMDILGFQIFGLTQQEEAEFGGDTTFYPLSGNPLLIQYKRTRKGIDGINGTFTINNNKRKNQHLILDMISRSGMVDTYYFFPLVLSNNFLTSNFGRLLDHTMIIEASDVTGNLNWRNTSHKIEVHNNGTFTVFSNEYKGESGMNKTNFLDIMKKKTSDSKLTDINFDEHIHVIYLEENYVLCNATRENIPSLELLYALCKFYAQLYFPDVSVKLKQSEYVEITSVLPRDVIHKVSNTPTVAENPSKSDNYFWNVFQPVKEAGALYHRQVQFLAEVIQKSIRDQKNQWVDAASYFGLGNEHTLNT